MAINLGSKLSDIARNAGSELESGKNVPIRYGDYLRSLLTLGFSGSEHSGANKKRVRQYPSVVRVAPSVAEMYKLYTDNYDAIYEATKDVLDVSEAYRIKIEIFKQVLKPAYEFTITEPYEDNMWAGCTADGINLRPGFKDMDKSKPVAYVLSDDIVHALIGGITGSGKSVTVNSVVMSMLYEYPPWELNMYLGDFKKVELSRFGNVFKVPHVKVIAATDSPSYVVSLFEYLDSEMKMLNTLFQSFGIQNIRGFRDTFNLALPRNIVIVDEFTQAFALATAKEARVLNDRIQSVAKLGRSSGYHLVFCSQTMSGTVESSVLNQFALGIALNSDDTTSNIMVGNNGAVGLMEKYGKGWAVVNQSRLQGDPDKNELVRAPFINEKKNNPEDKLSEFYSFLEKIDLQTKKIGYSPELQFYSESELKAFGELKTHMESYDDNYSDYICDLRHNQVKIIDKFILGLTTRYLGRGVNELESFDIISGRDKNFLVHSKKEAELKYMLLLLTANFRQKNYVHELYVGDINMYNLFRVSEHLRKDKCTVDYSEEFDISKYNSLMSTRRVLRKYCNHASVCNEHSDSLMISWLLKQGIYKVKYEDIYEVLSSCNYDAGLIKANIAEDKYTELEVNVVEDLLSMCNLVISYNTCRGSKRLMEITDLPVRFVWLYAPNNLSGCYRRGGITNDFSVLLEEGPAHNIFFILITLKVSKINEAKGMCSYYLVSDYEDRLHNTEDFDEKYPVEGVNIRFWNASDVDKGNFFFKKYQVTERIYSNPF